MEKTYNPEVTFNAEVIRDYCGTIAGSEYMLGGNCHSACADYIAVLPNAIDNLIRWYHFGGIGIKVDHCKMVVYNILIRELENVIPLDDSKWLDLELLRRVYKIVFGITVKHLGERLKMSCEGVMSSDYNKAKKFIESSVKDEEMKNILLKSINGYKPDKIDFNSFDLYFERFKD
jgi:hypothetical protein